MTSTDSPYDFVYERDQTPFLALCRGSYGFLHTSADRVSGVAVRQLALAPLGWLEAPSGELVVGDPFRGLRPQGNSRYAIPPGRHPVFQTTARVGEDDRIAALRTAYVSVVFREELMQARQQSQRECLARGGNPALPRVALRLADKILPDGSFSEEETARLLDPDIPVLTGCLAMADAAAFEDLMPLNRMEAGQGWLETLFEHGIPGSWFDRIDASGPWPKGSSNHPLPGAAADGPNVVVCQTGWGDGRYRAYLETHEGQPCALHVDFQVIPSDPMRPWRKEG